MKTYTTLIPILLFGMYVTASTLTVADNQTTVTSFVDSDNPLELPLPQAPENITDPNRRAAYILVHFWDKMDFSDSILCNNSDFLEQNFANFVSLYPIADPHARSVATNILVKRAECYPTTFNKLIDIARKYLHNPNTTLPQDNQLPTQDNQLPTQEISKSPTLSENNQRLSEEIYNIFVQRFLVSPSCFTAQRALLNADRAALNPNLAALKPRSGATAKPRQLKAA